MTDLRELVEEQIAQIAADREHGARWLAHACARVMELACRLPPDAQTLAAIHDVARRLASTRPSMAATMNTVARIWYAGRPKSSDDSAATRFRGMQTEARRLQKYWSAVSDDLIRYAAPFLDGMLYTLSRSGTVEATLLALAHAASESPRIVVSESRPGEEGVGLADALVAAGWRVTLVADAAVGLFLSRVDAAVIGADSVRPDGDIVNKVGSYPLALAARAANKPLYVLCETLKIAPSGLPLVLESLPAEQPPAQPDSVTVDTTAFDVTPASLVTRVVTERGALSWRQIRRLSDAASTAYHALLDGDAGS